MLVNYVTMEDEFRARGYLNCNGPINLNDRDASISIIKEGTQEILSGIEAFIGEKVLRTIDYHLDRTEAIYLDLSRGSN